MESLVKFAFLIENSGVCDLTINFDGLHTNLFILNVTVYRY